MGKPTARIEETSRAELVIANLACLLAIVVFGCIAAASFLMTSVIDPAQYVLEHILFQRDIIWINLGSLAVLAVVLLVARTGYRFFAKANLNLMEAGLVVLVLALGLVWVLDVRSVPWADSLNLYEAATRASVGDFTPMMNGQDFFNSAAYGGYSYFHFYPFQLGFVAFSELVYRVFGVGGPLPMQIINVFCVAAAYLALSRITRLLFKGKGPEFFAIFLLAGCLQPILFCSFVYGSLIGMCCALWASLFFIKFLQTQQCRWVWPAGLLLVIAVLVKYNNMLYLAAFLVALLVRFLSCLKQADGVIAGLLVFAVLGAQFSAIHLYEQRSGTEFCEGVTQTLYLDMGLQESPRAPGWYTPRAKDIYLEEYLEPLFQGKPDASIDKANKKARAEILQRVEDFTALDYTVRFFEKKVASQWCEPTLESVWTSKVKLHAVAGFEREIADVSSSETISSSQTTGLTREVYFGKLGDFLEVHFDFYLQALYLMFVIGVLLMMVNRKARLDTTLLVLVLLGAFSYHLLFEGKSQYILVYIPLLIPYASYALSRLFRKHGTEGVEAKVQVLDVSSETQVGSGIAWPSRAE